MPSTTRRPSVELQGRDLEILRGLFEARVMTLTHMATFYFDGRIEAATKRIQKLKAAGIVAERPRRVYGPSVLFLTRTAFKLLLERGALSDYPKIGWASIEKRAHVSEMTLRHELSVMDVRAAFFRAIAKYARHELREFSTWPLLFRFRAAPGPGQRDILVRPDGFIRVAKHETDGGLSEHTFFLEVDRSTEPQEKLAAKAACYADYYRRGGLAARFGRPRNDYKRFPFRVLMICPNAERRNNAAERMIISTPPVLTQVWLSTFEEVAFDPLNSIWIQPLDYRQATRATDFAPVHALDVYRRQPERETFVRQYVTKHSLV